MEKKSAIAYRDFVLEADKAFNRIYLQEIDLTPTEIHELKEQFSTEQFEKMYDDFENELRSNLLKYDDTNFIEAYLKSVFDEACRYVDKHSHIPGAIIDQDFEIEFLLLLWKTMNEAFEFFNYYCDRLDNNELYKPLYKYLDEIKKETTVENNVENDDATFTFDPRFDFNKLKAELENSDLTPDDRYNLVNNRLFDFIQWQRQYDVYETFYVTWDSSDDSKYKYSREHYPHFEKLCKLELERWKNASQGVQKNDTQKVTKKQQLTFKIASKRKTDVVKILSAMYDSKLFANADGQPATNKQELMEAFGEFFGEDLKAYSTLLSQAKDKSPDLYLKTFDELKKSAADYCFK
jgi:hypothetical protein